jgi:hypothetical protein
LPVILHLPLNTYHSSGCFQSADTHAPLYVRGEYLILDSADGLLERLVLPLKSSVMVDFRYEGAVTNLSKSLIYLLVPHIVSIQEPKNIGSDGGRGNIDIDDGSSVYLAVICRPVER